MGDRENAMAQYLLAAAQSAGWKYRSAYWSANAEGLLFTFTPEDQESFGCSVVIQPGAWEADTSSEKRIDAALAAIKSTETTMRASGFDPTGPARTVQGELAL